MESCLFTFFCHKGYVNKSVVHNPENCSCYKLTLISGYEKTASIKSLMYIIFPAVKVYFYLYVCVCLYMCSSEFSYTFKCRCMWLCVLMKVKEQLWVSLVMNFLPYLFETGVLTGTLWLVKTAGQWTPGICLSLAFLDSACVTTMSCLFEGSLDIKLRSSCLYGSHFTDWAPLWADGFTFEALLTETLEIVT